MATRRRRRNGLALRDNGAKDRLIRSKSGMSLAALKKLKAADYAAYQKLFQKAGGAKALASWKKKGAATRSSVKDGSYKFSTWGSKKKKAAPKKRKTAARKTSKVAASGKKKIVTASNGRKMYFVGGKLVSKAVYSKAKANPRRRRNYGALALKQNRKRRNPTRRRRNGMHLNGVKLRHNPMQTGIMPIDAVASAVDKVPVVGKPLAPYVAPLAVGAASGAGVFFATNLIQDKLPPQVQPFSYALAGCLGAAATLFIPVGEVRARRMVAAGMATVGAGIDVYRHFFAKEAEKALADSGMSDIMDDVASEDAAVGRYGALALRQNPGYLMHSGYGAYEYTGGALNGYGALAMKQNSAHYGGMHYAGGHDLGGMHDYGAEEYTDAENADAFAAPADFDSAEGQVIIMGPRAWFRHFGRPGKRMYHRSKGTYSRHAGKRGHRWGWLIKLVGFKGARYIAGLQPRQRMLLIKQLKAQAQAAIQAHSGNILPSAPSVFSDPMTEGAHGYGATGAYGAMAYTGGPL